jgi:hypothetical protein
MSRKILTLVVLFFVCYMSAHYWLRWKNQNSYDSVKLSKLVDCDPNSVRSLKIVQRENDKEEELIFERKDVPEPGVPAAALLARAEWMQTAPVPSEGDTLKLNHLASMVCEIYDPIPLRASEMKMSFTKERRAVRLEAGVETSPQRLATSVFEFGMVTADRLNLVQFSGEKTRTVKIPTQLLKLSSLPPAQFKNYRVARLSADNIEHATVRMDGKDRFVLERDGPGWRITAGAKKSVSASVEADRYVNRIATLLALKADFAPTGGPDCEKGNHKVAVELYAVGGRTEILGFDYGKKGEVSACSSARSAYFKIHRDMVAYLETPPARMIKSK